MMWLLGLTRWKCPIVPHKEGGGRSPRDIGDRQGPPARDPASQTAKDLLRPRAGGGSFFIPGGVRRRRSDCLTHVRFHRFAGVVSGSRRGACWRYCSTSRYNRLIWVMRVRRLGNPGRGGQGHRRGGSPRYGSRRGSSPDSSSLTFAYLFNHVVLRS